MQTRKNTDTSKPGLLVQTTTDSNSSYLPHLIAPPRSPKFERGRIRLRAARQCGEVHMSQLLEGPELTNLLLPGALQERLVERRAHLDTVATHCSNEHLRPDTKKGLTSWTDLGVDGTFRKLTLD